MSKILVIDGLARSGTTLISSIIHSQVLSGCYRGVFHEFMACGVGKWPVDHAEYPLINGDIDIDPSLISYLKVLSGIKNSHQSTKPLKLSYRALKVQTLNNIKRRNQTDKIPIEQWEKILNAITPVDLCQLDQLYQEIARILNVNLLAFRWNQGLSYINKWLRNEDHYWVSIIRNPMDRALSAKKTFNWTYDQSIKATLEYSRKLEKTIKKKNHHLIYFEDIILYPEQTIKNLYSFLELPTESINFDLVQQSGKPYKIETSDLISEGKKHTQGTVHNGFDKNMINKFEIEMTSSDIDKFYSQLHDTQFLSRYFQ